MPVLKEELGEVIDLTLECLDHVHLSYIYMSFFRGTVERALARPYYDKTQRMPHAQSDRDVAHLAMLTARIKGRELDTGGGFLSHRMFNETQG